MVKLELEDEQAKEMMLFDKYREPLLSIIKSGALDTKAADIILTFNERGNLMNIVRHAERRAVIFISQTTGSVHFFRTSV